ncbi:FAD-dependent monooxygenase [Streptomyces olivaceoviridis]|uniref:FAD-dependent oxidoreductase n=2 Tax=Streptomyces canarius TaxID=285453 RepID=A0ABQ3D3Y1_9ACTN|nr:FAD-dependent oxidoreductase [Streptomyces canarius]
MNDLVSMIGRMNKNEQKRALVVGMGISGMATASRLRRAGWTPVIVERAPARRMGGYFVALFGAGLVSARRLGVLEHLHDRKSLIRGVDIDRKGRQRPGISYTEMPGEPWLLLRSDVERAAFAVLADQAEVRYSTVPTAIEQDADGVDVTLRNTATDTCTTERFDLVVGADGIRSTVRSLVFGPHEQHIERMGYMIAAFEYSGTPAGLTPGLGATLLEPDRSMWVYAFTDHDPTILLSYRTDDVDAELSRPVAESVRAAFGEGRPHILEDVLDALEASDTVLFDSAEQVRMTTWHKGRVVLLGDSAWCVTLYAGMGVSAALAGADLLGTLLERQPDDLESALTAWERGLRPYISYYQVNAFKDRGFFVANNRLQLMLRRVMPALGRTRLGRRLIDRMFHVDGVVKYKSADILKEVLGDPPYRYEEPNLARSVRKPPTQGGTYPGSRG